jgi:predicted RNase H-like HicB family nuclease
MISGRDSEPAREKSKRNGAPASRMRVEAAAGPRRLEPEGILKGLAEPPALRGESRMIFHVTLEQAEDGWIVAECPALPGCVSQGRDEKEALENIREAIQAWLWAEDQKAVAALPNREGAPPIVVAV